MQILASMPRSPRLSPKIARITDFAGREWVIACWDGKKWRGCQTGLTWSQSLPPKIAEIAEVAGSDESAEFADRDRQDYNGECRLTLRRLQRLLGLPRMQIFPGLSRVPRLLSQIAGVTDRCGREWVIACWDWKNWRYCQICRQRLPRRWADNAETAAIARLAKNAGIWKIAEIAETVAPDCRCYRYVRPRMGDCMLRLKKVTRLPVGIAETAEFDSQKCQDCRGCREWWECRIWRQSFLRMLADIVETAAIAGLAKNADISNIVRRRDCRPRLAGLPTLPAENAWLHAETEKKDEVARRE